MQPPLRVGILVHSRIQPRWVAHLIAGIQASAVAQVALVIFAPDRRQGTDVGKRKLLDPLLLYRVFTRLDDRVYRTTPDAFSPQSIEHLLANCPHLDVEPSPGAKDAWREKDQATVRASDLDVLVDLRADRPAWQPVTLARHGVWTLLHSANLANRAGPPGFWEAMEGCPVTGSAVTVCTDASKETVIYRSYACTHKSVWRNKNNYYWKTADFVLRQLNRLYERGPAILEEGLEENPERSKPQHTQYPGNAAMLRLLSAIVARQIRSSIGKILFAEQWSLAVGAIAATGTMATIEPRPHLRMLTPPPDTFWADPFPVRYGDEYLLFFEEFDPAKGRAHISVMRLQGDGRQTTPVRVLERPYHLSYPFVFRWQDNYYMLPETRENRRVELYRAERFPFDWSLDRVLLENVNATDATIACIGDRWWLFLTMSAEGAAATDELHLFHAGSPFGPWTPHARNPVKSDVRSARPAGRILSYQGELYRPAQDCSGLYGRAIVLHRIVQLDPGRYAEEEVGRVEADPTQGLLAVHTVNACDGILCLDGIVRRQKRRRIVRSSVARLLPRRSREFPAGRMDGEHGTARPFRFSGRSAAVFGAEGAETLNPFLTGDQPGMRCRSGC